jgi:2-methylcitrate dehydratase
MSDMIEQAGAERAKPAAPGFIRDLARWVRSLDPARVPARCLDQAKLLTLDTIGCGLAGHEDEVSRAVLRVVGGGAHGDCSIIGTGRKTTAANAVLANGTLVRVFDLNDYVIGGYSGGMQIGGHPSDNIPVALAIGESLGRPGRDVLAAVVIGYEIYGRFREMLSRDGGWDGVTISGLAAPAMAGYLMGLDEERLAHAIALSVARAPTSAAVRNGDISAAKSIANALVAQNGVQAAQLAAEGVTGPLSAFDQPRGLQDVFPHTERMTNIAAPLSEGNHIMRAHVKTYPCLATGQAAVAAALAMHKRLGGKLDGITAIDVIMADYKFVRRQQQDPHRAHPNSREAADHSFYFLVAVALLDGAFGLAQFEGERWTDPAVTALMAKMTMVADAGWNERAPGGYPCALRLTTKDGSEHVTEVAYPPGFSRNGIDEAAVFEKFNGMAASVLDEPARRRLIDAVMNLEAAGLAPVFAAMAHPNG